MCRSGICFLGLMCSAALVLSSSSLEGSPGKALNLPVDAQVRKWVEMWNSYDLSLVDELFLLDSRLSYFSSEKEGAMYGIEAVRAHHVDFGFIAGGKKPDSRLWLEDVHIDVFDSAAVVTGIWYFQRSPDTVQEAQRGPVTIVYMRHNTEWRIAHMHFADYSDGD